MDKDFKGKKILILGLGVNDGGVGTTKFFASQGAEIIVTDLKFADLLKTSVEKLKEYENITFHLGEHLKDDIDWADIVVRNPAIKPDNEFLEYALKMGKEVVMDLNIFLRYVDPSQIIGVTGTKGKSTTASLIYQVLKDHRDVLLAGNIGKSMLDCISQIKKNTVVILELSSFQLQALEKEKASPKYSVITNIFPDHLNYHSSMEEYTEIKRSIVKYQDSEDYAFFKKDDEVTNTASFRRDLKGQIIYYSGEDLPKGFKPKLLGSHNMDNIAAALKVSELFNIAQDQALKSLTDFNGVEFRSELVYNDNGIKIYNDTTATNPTAAAATLKSLPGSILIAGGMDKKMDYKEFVKTIDECTKEVYFIVGDATDLIMRMLYELNTKVKLHGPYDKLDAILKVVKKNSKEGDIILFSPGATSFNLFQNEFDRGRKFNEAVQKVFE